MQEFKFQANDICAYKDVDNEYVIIKSKLSENYYYCKTVFMSADGEFYASHNSRVCSLPGVSLQLVCRRGKTEDVPSVEKPEQPTEPSGVKHDASKLQWWYMWQFLPELEQVASVLQYGDTKYPAEDGSNWKRLDKLEQRASSAAMRHLSAYLQDNKLDDETSKSHLAHCITNLLFLMYNDRTKNEPL